MRSGSGAHDLAPSAAGLLHLDRARAAHQRDANRPRAFDPVRADRLHRCARRQRAFRPGAGERYLRRRAAPGRSVAEGAGQRRAAARDRHATAGSPPTISIARSSTRSPTGCAALVGFGANLLLSRADAARGAAALARARFPCPDRSLPDPDGAVRRHRAAGRERLGTRRSERRLPASISAPANGSSLRPALVPPRGEARADIDWCSISRCGWASASTSGTAMSTPGCGIIWRRAG